MLDHEALERMIDDDVGLVAMTWVPTNGGLVNPAQEVGNIARKHGVPYLLDACQAAGQMPIDVKALGCDFLSATGRKFLRGPRGTGFLFVAERWLEDLEPVTIDHFAAPWTARDQYTLRDDARRFETWENSYALRMGLGAAVDYADRIGIHVIEQRVRALAARCREKLSRLDRVIVRDLGEEPCGIVSFSADGVEPKTICAKLSDSGYVIGASATASTRLDSERRALPTLLRISPHYYNSEQEVDAAVDQIEALLS